MFKCSHSPKRSIQLSTGKFCFRIPNPCPPFEYICNSADFPEANQSPYSYTLLDANPNESSVAAAMNNGGASTGTVVFFKAPTYTYINAAKSGRLLLFE